MQKQELEKVISEQEAIISQLQERVTMLESYLPMCKQHGYYVTKDQCAKCASCQPVRVRSGIIVCPSCKGTGEVDVRTSAYDTESSQCQYCAGKGRVTEEIRHSNGLN